MIPSKLYSAIRGSLEIQPALDLAEVISGGDSQWRVVVQFDSGGKVMPAMFFRDHEGHVHAVRIEWLGAIADKCDPEPASQLRALLAQYRAEQAGLVGRA